MFKFVILSSKEENRKAYKNVVDKIFINYDVKYNCYCFSELKSFKNFCELGCNSLIYIIDECDKINSKIIIHALHNKYNDVSSLFIIMDLDNKISKNADRKLFPFGVDIIQNKERAIKYLYDDICQAMDIMQNRTKTLDFSYDGLLYKLQLSSILYIEKEPNTKKCKIVCKEDEYKINKQLNQIETMLDNRFIKTHRSIIVNKDNIKSIVLNEGKIIFCNKKGYILISRSNKKLVKEIMTKHDQKITN